MLEAAVIIMPIAALVLFWFKLSLDMYIVWSKRTIWWRAVAVSLIAPPIMVYGELARFCTQWTTPR